MTEYDLLVRNTRIVDGTGAPSYRGSIGVKGDKIVAVGDLSRDAVREIDGSGLVTTPGFIDSHNHADWSILHYPLAENFVMQGTTMSLGGQCGTSPAPLKNLVPMDLGPARAEYLPLDKCSDMIRERLGFPVDWRTFSEFLSKVEETGLSINYAPFVGHNTVRVAVMGEDHLRESTESEREEMKLLVEEAMLSGAFGISTQLDPGTGDHASIDEVIELAKVAQRHGGLYSPHKRQHQSNWYTEDPKEEGYGIVHAPPGEVICGRYHGLLEAIEVSRITKIPLLIAHLAPAYYIPQPSPEYLQDAAARATIEIIDKARGEGLKIFHNAIAHSASIHQPQPVVASFFNAKLSRPEWLEKMNAEEFVEKLGTREFRERVRRYIYSGRFKFGMFHPLLDPYWTDIFRIFRCRNKEYEGKTIGEIARKTCPDHIIQAQYEESYNTLFDILVEDPETTWVGILDKREYQEALRVFFKHPFGMPCTDCGALPSALEGTSASRVAYGMFPHYIDKFVKEERVLSLEEAIYHMTYLPAQEVLGLKDRGIISPGAYADIVVFDFERIKMAGTYQDPSMPPEGIEEVIVNGEVVYEHMKHTGKRPGKVLRHRQ